MSVIDRQAVQSTALRSLDRQRLTELVEAVCEHRRNAMVVCGDELRLELIGVHLARALRQAPQVRMELYLPSSTDSLLARFNAILDDLPVVAARTPVQAHGDLRVWVLHLTQVRELPEVQVLLRLVQSFPGAGVRLLLLLSREVADGPLTGLLGGRLHRWTVEEEPSGAIPPADGMAEDSGLSWWEEAAAGAQARRRKAQIVSQAASGPLQSSDSADLPDAPYPLQSIHSKPSVLATVGSRNPLRRLGVSARHLLSGLDPRGLRAALAGGLQRAHKPRMRGARIRHAWTAGLALLTLAGSALIVHLWRSAPTAPPQPGPATKAPVKASVPATGGTPASKPVPEIVEYVERHRAMPVVMGKGMDP